MVRGSMVNILNISECSSSIIIIKIIMKVLSKLFNMFVIMLFCYIIFRYVLFVYWYVRLLGSGCWVK